jgi:acyl carrier protein
MTKDEIAAFCVDQVVDIVRLPKEEVDTRTNFARLGLDSAMSIYLVMELEDKVGLELSNEILVDYPTIELLSGYLAEQCAARAGGQHAAR